MQDEQNCKKKISQGASFIIRITDRKNDTWQGSITWTDRGVTKYFRSSLELIKLMDSAVQAATPEAGYKVTDKGKENIRRIKTERRSSI